MNDAEDLRQEILAQVAEYYNLVHASQEFVPGKSRVQYAGRVYDQEELQNVVSAALDFWLTAGPIAEKFEKELTKFIGVREIIPVNSGSSANLLAVSALASRQLRNGLRPGDEVIVPAASFPTTINPIIQNGLIPVFIDSRLGDYNLNPQYLEDAYSSRTRAVVFAHTLGNPADMDQIMTFVRKHDLFLVEDTCDALGSQYGNKYVGTFGHIATLSFYPAHHITTGEGGATYTSSRRLAKIARTIRDWGRDCWCGYDNPVNGKCGKRFEREVPGMPGFYDHRYFYTEIGYNLKMTDLQAAVGLAQIKKLPDFIMQRKENFSFLFSNLAQYGEFIEMPSWHPKAEPAWFAFPITVKSNAPFSRYNITRYLEGNGIETRPLFAGNLLKQPAYQALNCRVVGDLTVSDQIMESTFFIGVYPGLNRAKLEYIIDIFDKFFRQY